ncbi:hypothetical protein BJ508DRAFT_416835 [Ascobolus immersus RN42]|uniref:Uncharacterized protein n=1 Tax=Ascobolus immersus RN42 TaxID=1160509 RepID=A0A3N4I0R7_ASCIM|nr:hypothetical protein BJ508DRAFT_416835 [Ascobolus immersus RN42]
MDYPYRQGVMFIEDLFVARRDNSNGPGFLPGVLMADGVVKLLTVNGNVSREDYQTMLVDLGINGFVGRDYDQRKENLFPNQVSLCVGTGSLNSAGDCLYHDLSSLPQSSGGSILNSRNRLIAIQNGGGRKTEDHGKRNAGLYLNHPRVRDFLRQFLLPLLPTPSNEFAEWSTFVGSH